MDNNAYMQYMHIHINSVNQTKLKELRRITALQNSAAELEAAGTS